MKTALTLLLLLLIAPLRAGDTLELVEYESFDEYYSNKTLYFANSFLKPAAKRGDEELRIGLLNSAYERELQTSQQALREFRIFKARTVAFCSMYLAGFALLTVVPALNSANDGPEGVYAATFPLGFGLVIGAFPVLMSGHNHLQKSLWEYNRKVIADFIEGQ